MGVFDRITKTINSAGENVAKKAKDVTEITKCNSRIEESKTRIKNLYVEIGKYCWENRQSLNADDQMNEFLFKLEQENQTISELQDTIRQLKGIEICENCGAELVKGANFCNVCGAPVVRKAKNIPVCANCGAELEGDEVFCQNCGARVEPLAPEFEPAAEEMEAEREFVQEAEEAEAEPEPAPAVEEAEAEQEFVPEAKEAEAEPEPAPAVEEAEAEAEFVPEAKEAEAEPTPASEAKEAEAEPEPASAVEEMEAEPTPAPTPAPLMPGMRICPNCQERIGKDERFCKNCGTPVPMDVEE